MTVARIVLDLQDPLTKEEQASLQLLLSDALGDFRRARGPMAEDYVEKCYGNKGHTDAFLAAKVKHVAARRALATKLHNAALYPRYEEVAAPPCSACFGDGNFRYDCICSCDSTIPQSTR